MRLWIYYFKFLPFCVLRHKLIPGTSLFEFLRLRLLLDLFIALDYKYSYHKRKRNTMFGLGLQELIVILLILLLLFGSKKLPELSKSMGEAIKELRRGFADDTKSKKA